MTLWEILKANKTGIAPDMFTMLAASKMNGGRDRLHELSGTPPLSFTAKGKPLTAWSITGNTVQNGTPTPENPVEVQAVGDKTSNLLNFEDLIAAPSGKIPSKDFTFPHLLTLYLKPNTTYTCASSGTGSTTSSPADLNRSLYFCSSNEHNSVNVNNPVTYTTDSTGQVFIGFIDSRTNAQQYLNKTAYIWLNVGSAPLPYEPYGYKIPVVTSADGTEPITTPIYLPTPLYSGEVMRSDGTITRSDGTTETFTAPQIPTLNGTTVIDVDTAVKPESMTIKYRR